MNLITAPKIYIIGRQTVDERALVEFLNDAGFPDWTTDAPNAAQTLVEVAGRGCYQSFKGGRKHDAYMANILESGHGCYDEETEVLSETGWIRWPDVTMSHRLATRRKDGFIEYHLPVAIHHGMYDGRMYKVDGANVDLLVTPNHRMLVSPTTTRAGRARREFRLVPAEELDGMSAKYCKVGLWLDGDSCPEMGAWIELLGFAIGDGYLSRKTGRRLRFRLRRPRKVEYLTRLCREELGLFLKKDNDRYSIDLPPEFVGLFRRIYNSNKEKAIPQHLLLSLGRRNLQRLMNGLINSDGSVSDSGAICYDTTSRTLSGQFQQLCLHLGKCANISQAQCYVERNRGSFGKKPIYRSFVQDKSSFPEINKWAMSRSRSSWIDEWSGTVHCAQVPNNTLYVRRNGKPVWCGNSVIEHAVWNLIITGVSRSLTHELIRHRVGISPSELSQRFVDCSGIAFVVPPAMTPWHDAWKYRLAQPIEKVAAIHDIRVNRFLDWMHGRRLDLAEYERQTEWLMAEAPTDLSPTDRRKYARQAARSVLPNCTETKIFITANARALRRFLELRGSRHADDEIRRLAHTMLPVMQAESPGLFGDYRIEDGEIKTEWRKV